MDRRDFLLLRRVKTRRSSHYVLSCEWLYRQCVDKQIAAPASREAAVFDEESIRLIFDRLDDRLREVDTVRVTNMDWLVGDIRKEFGNLMRGFRSRGGRVEIEKGRDADPKEF
jgi:hypothetical protein